MGREPKNTEREDQAVIDAYERRRGGQAAPDGELPPDLDREVEGYLMLQRRVAALDLPAVSPGVRSAILTAAAQAVEDRRPETLLSRILAYLSRPGPMLIGATAAALIVAVTIRPHAPPASPVATGTAGAAVAQNEPAAAEPMLQAMPEPLPVEAAATPEPAPAAAGAAPIGGGEAPAEPPAPLRAIAAHPASLGPTAAPAPEVAEVNGLAAKDEPRPQDDRVASASPPAKAKAPHGAVTAAEAPPENPQAPGSFATPPARWQAGAAGKGGGKAASADKDLAAEEAGQAYKADPAPEPPSANQRAVQAPVAAERKQVAEAEPDVETGYSGKPAPKSAPKPTLPAPMPANQAEARMNQAPAAAASAPPAAAAEVADLRARAQKLADGDERSAVLLKLVDVARKAGDGAAEKWARAELQQAEAAVARRRAESKQATEKSAEAQKSAPVQRAKAAPSQPLPVEKKGY